MSLNSLISSGLVPRPQRITIYGPNGIGKSTLAKMLPCAVFIDAEDGTTHIDVARIRVQDTMQLFEAMRALGSESHDFKTVLIDTIDAVEKMLRHRVCQNKSVKSIEDIGYGKGWTILGEEFTSLLHLIDDWLIRKGLNILIIGHSQTKNTAFPDASNGNDR